jgi:hypothetical protein
MAGSWTARPQDTYRSQRRLLLWRHGKRETKAGGSALRFTSIYPLLLDQMFLGRS